LKSKTRVSAPGKLMLFGEHAVVYGRPCIVTAVDQRISVEINLMEGSNIELKAPDVQIKSFKAGVTTPMDELPKGASFVFTAVKNFFKEYKISSGLKITTKSDFSSKFGFGSSSAVTVCVVKGLSELFEIRISNRKMFDICYKTVLDVQGVGSGFDLAAAIWGGTVYFVGGGKKIIPLKVGKLPLVVGYTGIKADTATLVRQVGLLFKENKKRISEVFDLIGFVVEDARKALLGSGFVKLGKLANINQGLLESLTVNTTELSSLIFAARSAGASGAKLSGAGGGDCMIAFSDNKARIAVEKAISKKGGMVIHVKTGAKGVRIEKA